MTEKTYCDNCGIETPNRWSLFFANYILWTPITSRSKHFCSKKCLLKYLRKEAKE